MVANEYMHTRLGAEDYGEVAYAESVFLSSVECQGTEAAVSECDLDQGFLTNTTACPLGDYEDDLGFGTLQLHVACRQFPVLEALEAVTTPGAGTHIRCQCHLIVHCLLHLFVQHYLLKLS